MKFSNFIDHPKFTLAGILIAISIAAPILQKFDFSHPTASGIIGLVSALATALLGGFAKGEGSGDGSDSANLGGKVAVLLLLTLWLPAIVRAQQAATAVPSDTATMSTPNGFTGSSEAVAVHFGGVWSAGTHITESYDFLDFGKTKAHHIYIEGHEFIAPTPGVSIYGGGLRYEPDLSTLLAKTNVPATNFGLFIDAAAGNGIPTNGNSHMSYLAGGGVRYKVTNALTWTSLQAQWIRFGSANGAAISTGLAYIFGK